MIKFTDSWKKSSFSLQQQDNSLQLGQAQGHSYAVMPPNPNPF